MTYLKFPHHLNQKLTYICFKEILILSYNMEYISYNLNGKYGEGKTVLLSKADTEKLNGKSLCCLSSGYVMIWDKKSKYLHRWLFGLEADDKRVVDHIDGNKLNCTRENLRLCTVSENMHNRSKIGKNGKTASKYKGVVKKIHQVNGLRCAEKIILFIE